MADFTVRSDAVDVEEIMRQIRARIRDKRGVDYTEEQIQELANARLERFLDPRGVRSDLLEQYRKQREGGTPPSRAYAFEDTTLFDSDKPLIRFVRRLLKPVLKLFFNYNVLNNVLHTQAAINHSRDEQDLLAFEVMHNLVVEMTRTSIEVKSLRMKLESVQSRLEFNERRARALEAVVQYKPEAVAATRGEAPPLPGTEAQGGVDPITGGESLRTKRRRRRRGRRTMADGAAPGAEAANGEVEESAAGDEEQGPGAHGMLDAEGRMPNAGLPADHAGHGPTPEARRFRAPDEQSALQRASPEPSAEAGSPEPDTRPSDQQGPGARRMPDAEGRMPKAGLPADHPGHGPEPEAGSPEPDTRPRTDPSES
jgi:hypothetical protein